MKWRKVKKEFKKKTLPGLVGLKMMVKDSLNAGETMTITGAKIKPAGGRKVEYSFSLIPDTEPIWENVQTEIDRYEDHIEEGDYNISFDIPDFDSKILNKTLGW